MPAYGYSQADLRRMRETGIDPHSPRPLPLAEALDLIAFRCREALQTVPHPDGSLLAPAVDFYALRNALWDVLSLVNETNPAPF